MANELGIEMMSYGVTSYELPVIELFELANSLTRNSQT